MFQSHVGKEDKEGGESAEPDPLFEEDAALLGQQQTDDDAEAEDGNGVFFFQAKTRNHAEPEPVARIITLDGEDGEVGRSPSRGWVQDSWCRADCRWKGIAVP